MFRDANAWPIRRPLRSLAEGKRCRSRRCSPAAPMALRNSSVYRNAADVAESLFAMLIAEVEIAAVDVDRGMLPKRRQRRRSDMRQNGKVCVVLYFCIIKYDKLASMET